MRSSRSVWMWIVAVAVVAAWIAPGAARSAEDAAAGAGAASASAIELDVYRLLTDSHVTGQPYTDNMYRMVPASGRQMVMVPFHVGAVGSEVKLDTSTLTLAAGRLVAWYIPYEEARSGPIEKEKVYTAASGVTVKVRQIPSRLARDLVLTADGRIQWTLPMVLSSFDTSDEANAYVMKVNRALLRPPVQPAIKREANESPADYVKRRTEALETHRREREEYSLKAKVVGELQTEFDEPAPETIWAIFEASQLLRQLKMTGPAPLPWTIDWEVFQEVRGVVGNVQRDSFRMTAVVKPLFAERQVLSDRAIAVVLSMRDSITHVAPETDLAKVVDKLVGGDADRTTRLTLVRALAEHPDAPIAPAMLLKTAADPDPGVSLLAMKSRVATAGPTNDPAFTGKLTDNASRLLTMPDGVLPAEVLEAPIALAGKQADAVAPLATGVKLLGTHARRRDQMIQAVLGWASAREPLAERWLDKQLLGGGDAAVTARTLALIDDPNTPPDGAAAKAKPAPDAPAGTDAAAEVAPVAAEPAAGLPSQPADAIEARTFYLSSPDHAIVKLLTSADASVRDAAWAALLRFKLAGPPEAKAGDAPAAAATIDLGPIYQAVATAAASLDPTPIQSLRFLDAQEDAALRQAAITRIAFEGKGPARAAALRWLAALGKAEFAKAFVGLNVPQRIEVAKLWYASDPSPGASASVAAIAPMLDLLGHKGEGGAVSPVVGWFVDAVVGGVRPPARDWAAAMENEEAMIDGLLGADAKVSRACGAALIALIAWPTDAMVDQVFQVVTLARREATDAAVVKPKVVGAWAEVKKQLAHQVAQAATGNYEAKLTMIAPRAKDVSPLDAPPSPTTVSLGKLTVAVTVGEAGAVEHPIEMTPPRSSGAVVADPSGLRIDKPDALAEGAAEAERSVITWPTEAITLVPAPRGGWIARLPQPGGPIVLLELTRAAE